MDYEIFEWEIKPKSSFITPLESDTIFGHIIWAIKYIDGDEAVEEVLKEFNTGNPKFIVSNGYYKGYFPFIQNQRINRDDTLDFVNALRQNRDFEKSEEVELQEITIKALKKLKKIKSIDSNLFEKMRNGYSNKKLIIDILSGKVHPIYFINYSEMKNNIYGKINIKDWVDGKIDPTKHTVVKKPTITKQSVLKNSINRVTNSTELDDGESGLFAQNEIYFDSNYNLSIFIKLRKDVDVNEFKKYLDYIRLTGYGKKKSSGKGYFETVSFEKSSYFSNDEAKETSKNGYMVLSNYIPKVGDYKEVFLGETMIKRGKLGDVKAYDEKPFKKPIVMYKDGSVFSGESSDIKGKMVENVHFEKEIVHYGYGFSVGVKLNEND